MSVDTPTLAEAKEQSIIARERLARSLDRVRDRLNPRRVATRTARDIGDATTTAAEAGIDTVRRYPATIVGLIAVAGLFLARHRIADLVRSLRARNR